MKKIAIAVAALSLAGCAGTVNYQSPDNYPAAQNEKIINKSLDKTWADAVPSLSKNFFVINNIDKDSGLINVSFSGDPEKYIDCGRIESRGSNVHGKYEHDFSAASPSQQYQLFNGTLFLMVHRKISLDGRINLIFERVSPDKTKVTANTKYVVTRDITAAPVGGGFPQSAKDTINFNSGGQASFPGVAAETTTCVATGALEKEILEAVN